ncbi:MAG TPA: hypothetical protein VF086_10310 [Propionibacteriaceae bacterium]
MKAHVRDALREAGAEAGRKARADAGLPEQVEDHLTLQWLAELLIKASDRRRPTAQPPKSSTALGKARVPLDLLDLADQTESIA